MKIAKNLFYINFFFHQILMFKSKLYVCKYNLLIKKANIGKISLNKISNIDKKI